MYTGKHPACGGEKYSFMELQLNLVKGNIDLMLCGLYHNTRTACRGVFKYVLSGRYVMMRRANMK